VVGGKFVLGAQREEGYIQRDIQAIPRERGRGADSHWGTREKLRKRKFSSFYNGSVTGIEEEVPKKVPRNLGEKKTKDRAKSCKELPPVGQRGRRSGPPGPP